MTTLDSIMAGYQTQEAAATTSTATNTTMDSFSFLDLFLVQLENQDPTNPMDTTEMSNQLCNYSQLEQLQLLNENLTQMMESQQSGYNTQAVALIGKSVVTEGNELTKDEDSTSDIIFDLESELSEVTISIFDDQGNQVAEFTESNLSSGQNIIHWDGTDNNGEALADGNYTYEVTASGEGDSDVEIDLYSSQKVLSVAFRDGNAYLVTASGQAYSYASITQVL